MLTLEQLRFGWTEHNQVHQLSLQLGQGEILVLQGPSGIGKSTLIHVLAGFLDPLAGDARWQDQSFLQLPPWQRPLFCLFQQGNLVAHLDLLNNICLGLTTQQRNSMHSEIKARLKLLGLAGLEHHLPHQLSGGQQQRAALARALLQHKPLMLLDEPFSALDAEIKQSAYDLILKLVEQEQLSVLLVTHDSQDADALNARTAKLGPETSGLSM